MIKTLNGRLAPASDEELAAALAEFGEYLAACGFKVKPESFRFYTQALKDLPGDLIELAITRTIAQHSGGWLPKPGEIRARVAEDLAGRQLLLRQAEVAIARAEGRM